MTFFLLYITKEYKINFYLCRNSVVPTTEVDSKAVTTKDINLLEKEDVDYGVPIKRTSNRKRTISKTFEEASSWD